MLPNLRTNKTKLAQIFPNKKPSLHSSWIQNFWFEEETPSIFGIFLGCKFPSHIFSNQFASFLHEPRCHGHWGTLLAQPTRIGHRSSEGLAKSWFARLEPSEVKNHLRREVRTDLVPFYLDPEVVTGWAWGRGLRPGVPGRTVPVPSAPTQPPGGTRCHSPAPGRPERCETNHTHRLHLRLVSG